MKKISILFLVSVAILFFACGENEKEESENPYEGAWELTYSKYVYPDTTMETTSFPNVTTKLLTEKHYAFGRQDGINKIRGGGGEYSFKDDQFISYPKYHSTSIMVGDSGDIWVVTFSVSTDSIKVNASETWKRIKE
jgi:hypothetical protein